MQIGVLRETLGGERRVALVPTLVAPLVKKGHSCLIERGAGERAGYVDSAYQQHGATVVPRAEVYAKADVVLQVRGYGSDLMTSDTELQSLRKGQLVVAMQDPLASAERMGPLAKTGATVFAMELIPRITRAQSMDVLSSMANLAGYKCVLLAANELPKMFPMMMTAAGTISPARVLVLGAGVAGLQAIATAKRLGAVVEAYDIRPEVKEQVQSVGGKFVELPMETEDAGDTGGYAKAQSEEVLLKQRELLAKHVAGSDAVITTAAVPGRPAPKLISEEMVRAMQPGSVVVDLAAETGGNCVLTQPGDRIDVEGVIVLGPTNIPSTLPFNASQLYAKNVTTFLAHLTDKEGSLVIDTDDEITRETLVAREGAVVHERVKRALESAA